MISLPVSLFIIIASTLLILALGIVVAYLKFPLHLIYKSKVSTENMLDGITDPIVVVSADYQVKRANKAYMELVGSSFHESIGKHCFMLLRGRKEPCVDCRLSQALASASQQTIEHTDFPSGKGALRINFSPFFPETGSSEAPCIIEHIRDITILEKLKNTLEEKNITLAQITRNLKKAQRNIREDLHLARQIQQGILPKGAPEFPGLSITVTYHPIAAVGGDLYDFIPFSTDKMAIFIGDASGHGLSSSLIGTISKMSLFHNSKKEVPPGELLAAINRDLIKNIKTNHYLTCFIAIYDRPTNTLTFSRAGHPMPLVIRKDGSIHQLKSAGTFAGVIENIVYEEVTFKLEKGDRFYLFTDGIYEVQKEASTEYLGYEAFIETLAENNKLPLNAIIPAIEQRFDSLQYSDDYTIIVIEATKE